MDYYDPVIIKSVWLFTKEIHRRCVPTEAQSSSDHRNSKASELQIPSWESSLRTINCL